MEKEPKYSNFKMTIKHLSLVIVGVVFLEIIQQLFSLNSNPSLKLMSTWENRRFEMILEVVLFAPIIEEVIFRLPLRKTKLYLVSIFFSLVLLINLNSYTGFIICLSVCLFNSIIFTYQVIIKRNLFITYLAFISVIVFTITHINNYSEAELNSKSIIELITLLLPQLLLGLFCTIVRLKSNIWYSILLHSLYNGTMITFAIIQT